MQKLFFYFGITLIEIELEDFEVIISASILYLSAAKGSSSIKLSIGITQLVNRIVLKKMAVKEHNRLIFSKFLDFCISVLLLKVQLQCMDCTAR